jgi:hypothetical protein
METFLLMAIFFGYSNQSIYGSIFKAFKTVKRKKFCNSNKSCHPMLMRLDSGNPCGMTGLENSDHVI